MSGRFDALRMVLRRPRPGLARATQGGRQDQALPNLVRRIKRPGLQISISATSWMGHPQLRNTATSIMNMRDSGNDVNHSRRRLRNQGLAMVLCSHNHGSCPRRTLARIIRDPGGLSGSAKMVFGPMMAADRISRSAGTYRSLIHRKCPVSIIRTLNEEGRAARCWPVQAALTRHKRSGLVIVADA